MTALEQAKKDTEEMAEAIRKATASMVDAADIGAKQLAHTSGKLRDSTEKLHTAITKFAATAATRNFAEAADKALVLVDALERLAKLQESGSLDKVITALTKQTA